MSDLYPQQQLSDSKDCPPPSAHYQILKTRDAMLGEHLQIRRALPNRQRRMIGAWCFLDHFGPLPLQNNQGMQVGPHPHMGLQTVTWLIAGKILHRDSLQNEQIILPGQLNLMTAGHGITHAEESLADDKGMLHGAQLWLALPDAVRQGEPAFNHYAELPMFTKKGVTMTLLAGAMLGAQAPTNVYSPVVALDIQANNQAVLELPLNPQFEYGLLVLQGRAQLAQTALDVGMLMYVGYGHQELSLQLPPDARLLLIGGEPFAEEVLIWWNFVARSKAEIYEASQQWQSLQRFKEVSGTRLPRIAAPPVTL